MTNIISNENETQLKKLLKLLMLIVICFFLSIMVMLLFKLDPWATYRVIFITPFLSASRLSLLVDYYGYFIIAGLAWLSSFRFRVYNFGVPGQMIFAAIITFLASKFLTKIGIYSNIIVILLFFLALIAGAFYGLIAAVLKIFFRVNEIGSTILLNLIAWKLYQGLEYNKFYENAAIANNSSLVIFASKNKLVYYSAAIIIAIIIFAIVSILLDRRLFGFKLELASINQNAAQYSRLNPKLSFLLIMLISSSLAGLAGYVYFIGIQNKLLVLDQFFVKGYDGIFIILLALDIRWGILISALLFAFIDSQVIYLDSSIFPRDFWKLILLFWIYIVIIVLFVWNFVVQKISKKQILKIEKKEQIYYEL